MLNNDFFYHAVCPNLTTLNETSGVITSPYYPRKYPNNVKCSWQITASKGKRIVLMIKDYYSRRCAVSCTCDYLEIKTGLLLDDGALSQRMCGTPMDNVTFVSFYETLKVQFVSDGTYRSRGFKAVYTQVNYPFSGM